MKLPPINGPREYRIVKALAARGTIPRIELDKICGTTNAPQFIRQLRKSDWVIGCRRTKVTDRDGKLCWPGIYFVSEETQVLMTTAYKKWEAATSHSKTK